MMNVVKHPVNKTMMKDDMLLYLPSDIMILFGFSVAFVYGVSSLLESAILLTSLYAMPVYAYLFMKTKKDKRWFLGYAVCRLQKDHLYYTYGEDDKGIHHVS